jgi:hypothetical protein
MGKTATGLLLATLTIGGFIGARPAHAAHVLPLLEVKAQIKFQIVKTDRYQETFFVARDGTGLGSVSFQHSFFPWESDTSSLKAARTPLVRLKQALDAAQIGKRGGECVVVRASPWTGSYDVTWYGLNGRMTQLRVVFAFGAPEDATPCPVEVEELVGAVETFARDGLGLGISPSFP